MKHQPLIPVDQMSSFEIRDHVLKILEIAQPIEKAKTPISHALAQLALDFDEDERYWEGTYDSQLLLDELSKIAIKVSWLEAQLGIAGVPLTRR